MGWVWGTFYFIVAVMIFIFLENPKMDTKHRRLVAVMAIAWPITAICGFLMFIYLLGVELARIRKKSG